MSETTTNSTGDDKPTVAYDFLGPTGEESMAAGSMTGSQFGRYRIASLLGRGAMGTVYLAHDTQLERDVALKIPRLDAHHDPGIVQRFYREARAMATLHHPNLCSVYDVGQIDHVHYLTMAYIEGGRLSDAILDQPRMPDRDVALLVRKIALALDAAHRAGVIHRDLKPSNIMIDRRGEPVIMDFGLARRDQPEDTQLTQIGELMGTPEYMSPERIEGPPDDIGPPSDLYSLGVIMYQMLTGRLPFEGTMVDVIGQIVTSDPPPLAEFRPEVDGGLQAICLTAMARNAKSRFPSADQMAAALDDFLQGRLVSPAPIRSPAKSQLPTAPDRPPVDSAPVDNSLNDPEKLIANFFADDDQHRAAAKKRNQRPETAAATTAAISSAWPATLEAACQCGARFAARVALAGKTVTCPRCRGALAVPGAKIEVACRCGQRFAAKHLLGGKNVKCPKCSRPIAVPPLP